MQLWKNRASPRQRSVLQHISPDQHIKGLLYLGEFIAGDVGAVNIIEVGARCLGDADIHLYPRPVDIGRGLGLRPEPPLSASDLNNSLVPVVF